ncbi:MAG TPA: Gfo/Idh/MocA family oxidoreductase [Syntrophorhabdaceae bacterium]|nr:Gfo/Idh/MocA family oxidoreductase [Syntrophorhabdaceae bacterium]
MARQGRKIRWGILGYARIARMNVIPAILRSSNAEFYALASRETAKLEECAKAYPVARTYEGYDLLLDDPHVEAVYIPLPNALHKEWTIKAARKGKHVLCEKPVALKVSECEEMIRVCKEQHVKFMEAFMYRYTDRVRKAEQVLASGELGEIKYINSCFRFLLLNPASIKLIPRLGGGSLYDVGCYPVNFIGMITGEDPQSVAASSVQDCGVDVMLSAVLTYRSGIIATLHCGFNAYQSIYSEIVGTKGALQVPDTFLDDPGYITLRTDSGTRKIRVARSDRYRHEIEDFSRAIAHGGEPRLSQDETRRNAAVIDKIYGAIK